MILLPSAETETTEETETVVSDTAREALLEALTEGLGDSLIESHLEPGVDLTIRVKVQAWAETAAFMRDHQRFRYFDWLSAIDWMPSPFGRSMDSEVDKIVNPEPTADSDNNSDEADSEDAGSSYETGIAGGETRFQVFARVYSLTTQLGVTIKADVADPEAGVQSWINVYPGADWHEREIHEMFGINVVGHPRLHPLYLPGDFEGHPMRKDFPLLARIVKPWPGIVDVEPMPGEDEPAPALDNPEGGDA